MKNKLFSAVLYLLAVCLAFSGSVCVFADSDTVCNAQSIADGILAYKLSADGAATKQEWINGALAKNAGVSSEWYILALSQSGKHDMSRYCEALDTYISNNAVYSASSRLKYALAFMAAGCDCDYISEALEESVGKQGIMSWIYGLHLLTNGADSSHSAEDAVNALLDLQLSDGGWALTGNVSDVDVTSMAIQALAPYCEEPKIKNAVDIALSLLYLRQLEDGDFFSYGTPNAESVAQVITALSSLGIDFAEDSRFIKNGNTLLDGLIKYRLPNGGFSHRAGDAVNDNATAQALYSLVAYIRMKEGKSGLYLLDACTGEEDTYGTAEAVTEDVGVSAPFTEPPVSEEISGAESNVPKDSETDVQSGNLPVTQKSKVNYKIVAYISILVIFGIVFLILRLAGKANRKNLIAMVIAALLAAVFMAANDFSSVDSYYSADTAEKPNATGSVCFTIRCDTVAGKTESEYIPTDGVILEKTEFAIAEGDTVYSILIEAAKKYGIHVERSGVEGMAYINGINYLYEYQFGDLSGWVFRVNGERPSVGCDSYILEDNDSIEWLYTCELGNDLDKQ